MKGAPNGLCRPSGPHEDQRKRKERLILGPLQRTKKAIEDEGDCDTDCKWCTRNDLQRLRKEAGGVRNRKISRDHPNYIVEVGQNTEKSPGYSRRLTGTPVKDHQLKLV